jgi:hypothetical protein
MLGRRSPASAAIDATAMTDLDHNDDQALVHDLVQDPIVADACAPDVIRTTKLDRSPSARIACKLLDTPCNATPDYRLELLQVACR